MGEHVSSLASDGGSSQMLFLFYNRALSSEILHTFKRRRISFSANTLFAVNPRVESGFEGRRRTEWILLFFGVSWPPPACLRGNQWCSGLALVPWHLRKAFSASDRGTHQRLFLPFDSSLSWSRDSKLCSEDHFHKVVSLEPDGLMV